jgi:hypothetical protein
MNSAQKQQLKVEMGKFRNELEKSARQNGLIRDNEFVSIVATAGPMPPEVTFEKICLNKREFHQTPLLGTQRIICVGGSHV